MDSADEKSLTPPTSPHDLELIQSEAIWKTPPKSMQSRMGRKMKQRKVYHQERYLSQLKKAFSDADGEGNGSLTLEQWRKSTLKSFFRDGNVTDEEFVMFFKRIDANSDNYVTWNDLVHYLMRQISSIDIKKNNESIQFIRKWPQAQVIRSQMHREMVTRILVCNRISEYITLSSDSIRFWNPTDLQFKRSIIDPGLFATMTLIESFLILAVATTNRRLLFFDLDTLARLPVEISASPSSKAIKQMTQNDAATVLKSLGSQNMPLFNIPTELALAGLSASETCILFVGDDQGQIEVFKLIAPKRRQGMDYEIVRLSRNRVHFSSITQISSLSDIGSYASASLDNTVKFWSLDPVSQTVIVTKVFTDQRPIVGFLFSPQHKVLSTIGVSRDAFVWSLSPVQKIFKLGGHYNQVILISDYVTTTGEQYILTLTNKKEFRLWDAVNYRLAKEWSDPQQQRPENRYSAGVFDARRHAMIFAASYPVKWAEDASAMGDHLEMLTHNHPIVACCYSSVFGQIVTVDSLLNIKAWSLRNGRPEASHMEAWTPESSDAATATLDCSGRRLIISTFKNSVTLWNYNSGSLITDINLGAAKSLITILKAFKVGGREYLARAGWDKIISLYTEVEKGVFEQCREYQGHTEDISAIASFQTGIVSGSVKGCIISWSMDNNSPQFIYKFQPEATIECMAVVEDEFLIVGDSVGFIHILTLPKLSFLETSYPHQIYQNHSISAIVYDSENSTLYTADTLGYVKKWSINIGSNGSLSLESSDIYRCHNDEITAIDTCMHGKFLVTCGIDMCVRIYQTKDFRFVGSFNDESSWDIDNPATWPTSNPFNKDPNHFSRGGNQSRDRSLPTVGKIRSFKNLPHEEAVKENITSVTTTVEAPKPINYKEIGRELEDYVSNEHTLPAFMSLRDYKVPKPVEPQIPTLESLIRPNEVIRVVDSLLKRPPTSFGKTTPPTPKGSNQQRTPMKIPMIMPIGRKGMKGRIPQTPPLYD